jgi:hypothetical protein
MLLESDLPHFLVDCGLGDPLQELQAFPRVWKAVLERYPGREQMLRFADVPSGTEDSSQGSLHRNSLKLVPS